MKKYVCMICGYVYDEAAGIPASGIAPGTKWDELSPAWKCPLCGASKSSFKEVEEEAEQKEMERREPEQSGPEPENLEESWKELSFGELGALCSNLAKGCEKQYLSEEMGLFLKLADYYSSKAISVERDQPSDGAQESFNRLLSLIQEDLEKYYPAANEAAGQAADRGAKRALVWSEKVTRMGKSLAERYVGEGTDWVNGTKVYVCEICGFIYIGDEPPAICPVCKVPSLKIAEIQRR